MKRLALVMILAASAAQATPIAFTLEQYTTSAYASVPGGFDGPYTDVAPQPVASQITSASAIDGAGSAFAASIVDTQFLAAATDVTHSSPDAFGSGIATFEGIFDSLGGLLRLKLDFNSQWSGSAANNLNVVFVANGVKLLEDNFSVSGEYVLDFLLPQATIGILDLSLSSTADSTTGSSFGLSSASFTLNSVPEPGTLALTLLGLGGFVLNRKRPRVRAA